LKGASEGLQTVHVGPPTPILDSSEYHEVVTCAYEWRGEFKNSEVSALHGNASGSGVDDASETNWRSLLERHSLGWVTAREGNHLLGFVNVI